MYLYHVRNFIKLYYIMNEFLSVKQLKCPYSNTNEYAYTFLNVFSTFGLYIIFFILFVMFMYFRQSKTSSKMTGG